MPARALTSDEASLLARTRAADREGNPLVLHHGTLHRFDRFDRTVDLGFHFGTLAQARKRLATLEPDELRAPGAGEPRIVSVALAARNPVLIADDPQSWSPPYVASLFSRFLDKDETRLLLGPQSERTGRTNASLHAVIRTALRRAGHDSVVYRNQVESAAGSRGVEWSWLALDPKIIVHLGEGHPGAVLELPAGIDRVPGIDPDGMVREMGGLRRRNGSLASVADMRRYRDAGVAATEAVLGPCGFVAVRRMKALSEAKARIGPSLLEVQAMGDLGRITLKVSPVDGDELKAQGMDREAIRAEHGESAAFMQALSHLVGPLGLDFAGMTTLHPNGSLTCRWTPGEPMDNSVAAFRDMLGKVTDTLRALYEPEITPGP